VHPGDLLAIEAYPGTAAKPVPAGVEATGVVEAIGAGTRAAPGVKVGGHVSVFPQPGAWSQWIVADAEVVLAVPDELSDEVAAQLLVNPLTTVATCTEVLKARQGCTARNSGTRQCRSKVIGET
jgi:NADPH:quinone reductase-like Zn-dependent oxidoreductase